MKKFCQSATALAFLLTVCLSAAQAQGGAARPAPARPATAQPQQPAAQRPTGPVTLDGRIAIIDSDVFGDQQKGIKRLVAALNRVNTEFAPKQTELGNMKTRIQNLVNQINSPPAGTTVQQQQQRQDQAAALQRDWEYQTRETQAQYNRRMGEVMGPVYDDLGKALEDYARQRGISVILDSAKLTGAIFIANNNLDITDEFVTEYNRRNP